ncbi:MAG TPA: lysophospholipase [Balneola sp.]|nr:lysophospholipase [Bacteroidota bacterium]HCT55233.1 lysophospholipase [Balneola sp.]|tara:strand:- start:1218 stop:1910 length:693 start_codon:yes stop_codon:yes gene_type:complete
MDKKSLFLITFLLCFFTISCAQNNGISYLALGDSYTIGESVPEDERWPVILSNELSESGIEVNDPLIIAKTGWTTDELQNAIKEQNPANDYDLVSLLIGVNNQYRGYPIDQYKKEFKQLLLQAVSFANGDTTRVFVVSIPNYGVTPFGMEKGEEKTRQELLVYDAIADSISSEMNIPFINITPISEKAKEDSTYIASDHLHPSGKQYKEWVEHILPDVEMILKNASQKHN